MKQVLCETRVADLQGLAAGRSGGLETGHQEQLLAPGGDAGAWRFPGLRLRIDRLIE